MKSIRYFYILFLCTMALSCSPSNLDLNAVAVSDVPYLISADNNDFSLMLNDSVINAKDYFVLNEYGRNVLKISNSKVRFNIKFKVLPPNYKVFLINEDGQYVVSGSTMSKDKVMGGAGLACKLLNTDFDLNLSVKEFSVKYIKDGEFSEIVNEGPKITEEVFAEFKNFEVPGVVVFDDIKANSPVNGVVKNISPFILYLTK